MNLESVKAVVTDIEGTITDINFVKEILFPYSYKKMEDFVNRNWEYISNIVKETEGILNKRLGKVEFIKIMKEWIKEDKKITPLKELQGLIWEEGYKKGEINGHIYEDAFEVLKRLKQKNIPVYIYSSGSVKAQKLLFSHTQYGDITYLFSGYFDTKIGSKKERKSYEKIAKSISVAPGYIVFFSDNEEELKASKEAGMKAIKVARDIPCGGGFPCIRNFQEIEI